MIRKAIKRFKFNGRSDFAMKFARIIQNSTKNVTNLKLFDIIISVPMYKERLKSRGYNQSYLISRYLSKYNNINEMSNILTKITNTKSQSSLSKIERLTNVKDAFLLNDDYLVNGKNILLIDDVFTTGSTVNECSKVLIKNGAASVTVLVLASGNNF
jgi:ComF family protein